MTADAPTERARRPNPLLVGISGGRVRKAFDCPKYRPLPGSKRCQHYLDNGACTLPDEFMCVEWLKANGHAPPSDGHHASRPSPAAPPDLFGHPLPATRSSAARRDEEAQPPHAPSPATEEARGPIQRIPEEDVASFKALGVEVCLRSETIGEVWLVPEYTGRDRREITPEHAATLRLIVDAFPGARVVAFDKLRKESS